MWADSCDGAGVVAGYRVPGYFGVLDHFRGDGRGGIGGIPSALRLCARGSDGEDMFGTGDADVHE
jgi:hypothetical protein